jgi:proteasome assembly chaperone (PAC2) family protein
LINFLKNEVGEVSKRSLFKVYRKPKFQSSSLVVGWSEDAGQLGPGVIDYLTQRLGGERFAEIEPEDFFSLSGVRVEGDVAQFPRSNFYSCQENNLVIFRSAAPGFEWYKFLNSILDVAEHYCGAKELYTIGGMVTLAAHTAPRTLLATASSQEVKDVLSQYNLARNMNYETPPGQRPTLNSFLLWVARRRNIPGVNLWVPIPFYLVTSKDPKAQKRVLQFFDERFGLNIDFGDIDHEVEEQNEKLAQARLHLPEVDDYIRRLESNLRLSQEENERLTQDIEEFLRKEE